MQSSAIFADLSWELIVFVTIAISPESTVAPHTTTVI